MDIKFEQITEITRLESLLVENDALLVYFSHQNCNVCKVLKPKVKTLLSTSFPKILMVETDTIISPEVAAQSQIFSVPTMIVYFDGRELFRTGRNIGIEELRNMLARPYDMMFSE